MSGLRKTLMTVPTLSLTFEGLRENHRTTLSLCPSTSEEGLTTLSLIGGLVARPKRLKESPRMVPDAEWAVGELFIHLFSKHLLNTYCVPAVVQDPGSANCGLQVPTGP